MHTPLMTIFLPNYLFSDHVIQWGGFLLFSSCLKTLCPKIAICSCLSQLKYYFFSFLFHLLIAVPHSSLLCLPSPNLSYPLPGLKHTIVCVLVLSIYAYVFLFLWYLIFLLLTLLQTSPISHHPLPIFCLFIFKIRSTYTYVVIHRVPYNRKELRAVIYLKVWGSVWVPWWYSEIYVVLSPILPQNYQRPSMNN